jgi:hypothetical protein
MLGGEIERRILDLVPNRRIVQAGHVKTWPDGVFSIVGFELKDQGKGRGSFWSIRAFPRNTACISTEDGHGCIGSRSKNTWISRRPMLQLQRSSLPFRGFILSIYADLATNSLNFSEIAFKTTQGRVCSAGIRRHILASARLRHARRESLLKAVDWEINEFVGRAWDPFAPLAKQAASMRRRRPVP